MLHSFALILSIHFICHLFAIATNSPVPGTILALILLFILLVTKILKVETIEKAGNVLLANMVIMFLPPALKLLEVYSLFGNQFLKVCILLVGTTILTLIVTSATVQLTIRLLEKARERRTFK